MPPRKIRGRWYADFRWDGQRHRKPSPVNTRQGADAYERQLREKILTHGSITDLPDVTYGELAERWLREYVEPRAKRSGVRTKRSVLRAHLLPRFGRRRLRDIDAASIDRMIADLRRQGLEAKTVNNVVTVLRASLRKAVTWRLLRAVPECELLPARDPEFRFLEAHDVERLVLAAPPGVWRAMILFAAYTGLRANELLALEWTRVDLGRRFATVSQGEVEGHVDSTKTERIRRVPLSPEVLDALAALPRTSPRVFPMPPLRHPYHHALDALRAISRQAGIAPPVTWHVLRHTFATLALAGGAPLTVVRDVLGHTTIEMTNRYVHAATTMLHMATDALPRLTSFGRIVGTSTLGEPFIHPADEPTVLETSLNKAKTAVSAAV
ncbi:MAG: site-specific integrase [Sandaracinaceae bacterium]|nr:site-specific integrase [Sandaracinaceae bacterium]